MKRRKLIIIALAVVAAAGVFVAALIGWILFRPNRFLLRNAAGADVTDIRLLVTRYKAMERSVARLSAGESETFYHFINDAGGTLDFQLNGKPCRCEFFVDFWSGEGWIFEFQPDGTVKQGRDIPGYPLEVEPK